LPIASFCAGAAFGFWGEVLMFSASLFFAIFFSSLAVVGFSLIAVVNICGLTIKSWKFTTSELPPNFWQPYYSSGRVWRSKQTQSEGMFYTLDLGKEQRFNAVQFYHGICHETPKRWRVWFFDRTQGYVFPTGNKHPYIETGEEHTKKDTTAIIVELRQSLKARYIRVGIVEPATKNGEAYHWRIESIYLRKAVLGLKNHVVGRSKLDEL